MGNLTKISNTNLTSVELNQLFGVDAIGDDLSAGVTGSFAVVSFRGSKWRVKYQGSENLVRDADGDAVAKLECVLLKASKEISKIYYEKSYEEGDNAAPDCFSSNGVTPDPGAANPQAKSCAACPRNVWGSKITPAGKKAKACSDHRRVAIVPANDLENKAFGGPMLLRVAPASLAELSQYGTSLRAKGIGYNTVVTKLSFDEDASYPKLSFAPVRRLTKDEIMELVPHMQSDTLTRILSEATELVESGSSMEDDDAAPAPKQEVKAPKPEPKPEPKPAKESDADLLADLNADLAAPVKEEKVEKPVKAKTKAAKEILETAAKTPPAKPAEVNMNEDLDNILEGLGIAE